MLSKVSFLVKKWVTIYLYDYDSYYIIKGFKGVKTPQLAFSKKDSKEPPPVVRFCHDYFDDDTKSY